MVKLNVFLGHIATYMIVYLISQKTDLQEGSK